MSNASKKINAITHWTKRRVNGLYRFNQTHCKTHHLEEDNGQNSTDGEEDGHHHHNGADRMVPADDGQCGDPAAEDEGAVREKVKKDKQL